MKNMGTGTKKFGLWRYPVYLDVDRNAREVRMFLLENIFIFRMPIKYEMCRYENNRGTYGYIYWFSAASLRGFYSNT